MGAFARFSIYTDELDDDTEGKDSHSFILKVWHLTKRKFPSIMLYLTSYLKYMKSKETSLYIDPLAA